jgi:integrase
MTTMPRPRPPHLHRQRTRHGKGVWYVRVGHGQRIRLRAEYGTAEFDVEYRAALEARPTEPRKRTVAVGSLAWLFDRYRETGAWSGLSAATRRQRENILEGVLKQSGHESAAAIKRQHIIAGRDRRAETPAQSRNFLDAMRGIFRWAVDAGHVKSDPTLGVKNPARPKGGGFPVWTEDDVARYEARWRVGTKERLWLDVLAYTGLRRGDAVQLGRQHVRDGVATMRTEKTGVTVTIPILPALAATLAAGPTGELAFICGAGGRPLTKESFGNLFRDACRLAGVNKSAHGVRKIGATRAANNGATVAELEAIFGWQGGGMAALYTRAADRTRLAKGAMSKLERTAGEHSIPSPDYKVRDSAPKDK